MARLLKIESTHLPRGGTTSVLRGGFTHGQRLGEPIQLTDCALLSFKASSFERDAQPPRSPDDSPAHVVPALRGHQKCNSSLSKQEKLNVPSLSTSVVSGSGLPTQLPCQRILEASPLHKYTCGSFSVSISSLPCCSHTSYVRNQRKIAPVRRGNIWRQNVCGDTACPHWHAPSSTDTRGCVRYKQTTLGIRGPHL